MFIGRLVLGTFFILLLNNCSANLYDKAQLQKSFAEWAVFTLHVTDSAVNGNHTTITDY